MPGEQVLVESAQREVRPPVARRELGKAEWHRFRGDTDQSLRATTRREGLHEIRGVAGYRLQSRCAPASFSAWARAAAKRSSNSTGTPVALGSATSRG